LHVTFSTSIIYFYVSATFLIKSSQMDVNILKKRLFIFNMPASIYLSIIIFDCANACIIF
jgi:hypothetical protein